MRFKLSLEGEGGQQARNCRRESRRGLWGQKERGDQGDWEDRGPWRAGRRECPLLAASRSGLDPGLLLCLRWWGLTEGAGAGCGQSGVFENCPGCFLETELERGVSTPCASGCHFPGWAGLGKEQVPGPEGESRVPFCAW